MWPINMNSVHQSALNSKWTIVNPNSTNTNLTNQWNCLHVLYFTFFNDAWWWSQWTVTWMAYCTVPGWLGCRMTAGTSLHPRQPRVYKNSRQHCGHSSYGSNSIKIELYCIHFSLFSYGYIFMIDSNYLTVSNCNIAVDQGYPTLPN